MVQPREILYVRTIAQEQSYSRAAKKLCVSQPALSQSVQKLEARLGVPIFQREDGQMELTPAGRLLVQYGQPVLDAVDALEERMTAIVNIKKETLRIGASPIFCEYHLPRVLFQYLKQFPGVSVELHEERSGRLAGMVLDGSVDICLAPLPLGAPALEHAMLKREEIFFALPWNHPLKANLPEANPCDPPLIDLAVAREEPFIFLREDGFGEMGRSLCRGAGFAPVVWHETQTWSATRAFIENGLGVGFLPEAVTAHTAQSHGLACYRVTGGGALLSYAAAYADKTTLTQSALAFIRAAQEMLQAPIAKERG